MLHCPGHEAGVTVAPEPVTALVALLSSWGNWRSPTNGNNNNKNHGKQSSVGGDRTSWVLRSPSARSGELTISHGFKMSQQHHRT